MVHGRERGKIGVMTFAGIIEQVSLHASGVSILLYEYLGMSTAVFLSYGESFGRILLKNELSLGEAKPREGERQSPNDSFFIPWIQPCLISLYLTFWI